MSNSYNYPVVVGLSGGLGNQMFQYAAGRSLAIRLQVPLVLDLSWYRGHLDRQYALSAFNIEALERSVYDFLPNGCQSLASRASRRWFPRIMGVPVLREPHFHYAGNFSHLKKPVFLEGYWQSERYFSEKRSILLRDFSLRDPMPLANVNVLAEISRCDAICVHVRRGDYLSNQFAANLYNSCSVDYYRAAVEDLSKNLLNPHCFVFSDDWEWVRTSLKFDCPMTVVDINSHNKAHLDLILMAACKHFVIANSSFSWWGAWLGNSPGKKVIAPAKWFLNKDKDTRDLIPESWCKL